MWLKRFQRNVTPVWDRLLRRIGLMRRSQIAYQSMEVEWKEHEPVHVDIRFKNGERVIGYVDPWYPNKRPTLLHGPNPLL